MQRLHGRSGVVVDDGANDDEPGLMVAAVKAAKVELPAATALSLDRLGFRMWERVLAARRTSLYVPGPFTPFILALCSGGPPTIKGWAPPVRVRIKGLIDCWVY